MKRRIRAIIKGLENDAKRVQEDEQKPKEIAQKDKRIREMNTKKTYSGESSPYWEYVGGRQAPTDDGRLNDTVLANPDVLDSERSLYSRPLTEVGTLQLEAVIETMPKLSKQERRVIELCNSYTLEDMSKIMEIKVRSVRELLERAKGKIQKTYNRKLLQEK